jgi:hypothetical protein
MNIGSKVNKNICAAIVLFLLLLQNVSSARIYGPSLNQLVQTSTWIGYVDVVKIEQKLFNREIATAHVIETYKGQHFDTIQFYSNPQGTCDISNAEAGQKCFLFLSKNKGRNIITWAGRGKFLVSKTDGYEYFKLQYDVLYPYEVISNSIADTIMDKWGKNVRRKANVQILKKYIEKFINQTGQNIWDSFIPFNMFEWESFVSQLRDLTEDEIKTAFDGELNPNSTRRILELMLGVPRYISKKMDSEIWRYKTRNGYKYFKIIKDKVVAEVECPINVKWTKRKYQF